MNRTKRTRHHCATNVGTGSFRCPNRVWISPSRMIRTNIRRTRSSTCPEAARIWSQRRSVAKPPAAPRISCATIVDGKSIYTKLCGGQLDAVPLPILPDQPVDCKVYLTIPERPQASFRTRLTQAEKHKAQSRSEAEKQEAFRVFRDGVATLPEKDR